MSHDLILGNAAIAAIESAVDWYSTESVSARERFLDAIDARLLEIAAHPTAFSPLRGRPVYRKAKLRKFPYFLVFKVYEHRKQVFIALLVHEKRDSTTWLKTLR